MLRDQLGIKLSIGKEKKQRFPSFYWIALANVIQLHTKMIKYLNHKVKKKGQ